MTKPTVTQSTIQYALFRTDVLGRTADYALQGRIYDSMSEAAAALEQLITELPAPLKPFVEVRVVEGEYRNEKDFGSNPFARYS